MWTIIASIVGKAFGGGLTAITGSLERAHARKLAAANDSERVAADIEIAHLEAKQAILIAEQGHWMTRWIRPVIALAFAIYIWKVLVWDKVFGLGATDPLSDIFEYMMWTVLGAYFGLRPFEKRGRTQ